MRAAWAITSTTVKQLLGVRRMIVFGLAELAPAGVFLLMTQTLAQEAALDRFLGMVAALYFPLLVPIVTLIVAASALGDERRDGTLSFLVLRPIPRSVIACGIESTSLASWWAGSQRVPSCPSYWVMRGER